MTSFLYVSGAIAPLIFGALLMTFAAAYAIRDRFSPKRLILWGALLDLGMLFYGLAPVTGLAFTGFWLYFIFQFCARCLAWFGLANFTEDNAPSKTANWLEIIKSPGQSSEQLTGIGRLKPLPGMFFGLGMFACIGGSPFLLPEGRALIVSGLLEAAPGASFFFLMLMGFATTVFIWLYVACACKICLANPSASIAKLTLPKPSLASWIFAILVIGLGIFRTPVSDLIGYVCGYIVPFSPVHISFWIYYLGSLATAAAFVYGLRYAPQIGALFCAAAFASIFFFTSGPLANLFLFIITFIGLMVAIYSLSYIHDDRKGWYWFFLLLTFSSLSGIVSTPEVSAMYGYWELMTFASYFLVAHEATDNAFAAALKYYVMCAGGAIFMLPGLEALGAFAVDPNLAYYFPFWLKAGILLCLVGFGVKAGLVPFQSWLPEAHPAAPSSVSAPLSGVITKMGIFGLVSIILIGVGQAQNDLPGFFGLTWFGSWLALMAAATLIYGEAMALMQTDIKRLLAFSTIGQIGEIALILSLGTWLATAGSLWHVFNHAIMKDLLFLGAGAIIIRTGSRSLKSMAGIARQMPWTVSCIAIGLVSIMGLPPFGSFYSKFLMIQAAIDAGQIWAAVLLLAGALAGAIYYTRILKIMVLEQAPENAPQFEEAPMPILITLTILAAVTILLGLMPQLLMPLILPSASLCYPVPENAGAIIAAMTINWPIYVIFPIFGAVLPAIFWKQPRMAGWMSVGILIISAILAAVFGRNLDTLSYCFALIVPVIGAINMCYAVGYMAHGHSQWRFYCAFTCMCGGLIGMAASSHLLGFFLFWEVMSSWALYLAIAQEATAKALKEAFKYFFFNLFGASFLFIGLCIIGPDAPFSANANFGAIQSWLPTLGMALLAIGFVMKAAQLPFRIDWQMHPALAPTPVSGYISSVLLKAAIIGLVKLFALLGGALVMLNLVSQLNEDIISVCVMWIGGITIIMAAIQALRSNGLKLVFIYSTVSQLGYMVLAVACGTALGYAGGLLHLVNHIFFKDLLFLVCGAVMIATHKETLYELGGIGRRMPFTLLMFAIGGLSLVGLPPTSGFSSKWIIYQALMQAEQPLLALLSLVGSVLTLAYVAKFLHAAFLGQPGDNLEEVKEAPLVMTVPMGILAIGCVLTGIFPGLALWPINKILVQYGLAPLDVSWSGLISGPGAWNATGMFILMAIAFLAGLWFIRHYSRFREIDIHTCGLPVEEATSRMNPDSIYGDLARLFRGQKEGE